MTAARSTPNPNTRESRPRRGESRRRRFSPIDNSEKTLVLRVRTFGPMIRSWARDTTISRNTSINFTITAGGQEESGAERMTTLPRSAVPVTIRRDSAPHTSVLKRRARFTNLCWVESGSESFRTTGTTTKERNIMPPTQKVAATR